MQTVFITGANRGLGLEFTRQYLAQGAHVIATCRQPENAEALHRLQKDYGNALTILPLDIANEESILSCVAQVRAHISHLDVLINNAGIPFAGSRWESSENFGTLNAAAMLDIFFTNAVGPLLLAQALLDLLKAADAGTIAYISSLFASIEKRDIRIGTCYGYSGSKVAGNMYIKILAQELASHRIRTVTLDPGWVKTDMGGSNAPQTPEEVVTGMCAQIAALTPETSGRFITWSGHVMPW
jgi:NAD(P)-dependent dehydrogenase (short-subunit alcohol dehydrogenase family)